MTSRNGTAPPERSSREVKDHAARILRAMKKAVREAALAHQREGVPMVICDEDGKVRKISAEEFLRPGKNGRKKRAPRR